MGHLLVDLSGVGVDAPPDGVVLLQQIPQHGAVQNFVCEPSSIL